MQSVTIICSSIGLAVVFGIAGGGIGCGMVWWWWSLSSDIIIAAVAVAVPVAVKQSKVCPTNYEIKSNKNPNKKYGKNVKNYQNDNKNRQQDEWTRVHIDNNNNLAS